MFNIFEQPWTLLITAILVFLVVLMFRRIAPEKRRWWQLALPIFFSAAAFGLDLLVQTNLEKINAVIDIGVKAVEEENCDAISKILSDNYRDSHHNTKKSLMRHCREKLSEPLVEKNIKRILAINIPAPETTATAIFTVRVVFDKRSYIYQDFKQQIFTKVRLDLQKEPDKSWLINRAEILEVDRQPAMWKQIK